MAVIPKLILDLPDHHVEVRRYNFSPNELQFTIIINDAVLGSAKWIPHQYWELSDCSVTIEDMQDVVLPALLQHIKKHSHGMYISQGLYDDGVNKNMLFKDFENVVSY